MPPQLRPNIIDMSDVVKALEQIDPAERGNWLAEVELRAMERGDQVLLDAIDDWRLEQRFSRPASLI